MQGLVGVNPNHNIIPSDSGIMTQEPSAAMRLHAAMQAQALRQSVAPSLQAYPMHFPFAMADPRFIAMAQDGSVNAVYLTPMGMSGFLSPTLLSRNMQPPLRPFSRSPAARSRHLLGRQHLQRPGFRAANVAAADFTRSMATSEQEVEMYLRNLRRAQLHMNSDQVTPNVNVSLDPNDSLMEPKITPSSTTSADISPRKEAQVVVGKQQQKKTAGAEKIKKNRADQKDKPKRPLSAYNCFFKEERARILGSIPDYQEEGGASKGKRRRAQHGKISFEELGKTIGQRWQNLSPEESMVYKMKAAEDMTRYRNEMAEYLAKQEKESGADTIPVVSPETTVSNDDSIAEVSDHEEGRSDSTENGDEHEELQHAKKAKYV